MFQVAMGSVIASRKPARCRLPALNRGFVKLVGLVLYRLVGFYLCHICSIYKFCRAT